MTIKNKNKQRANKYNYTISLALPLILILSIIPLIVRMKIVPLEGATAAFQIGQDVNTDFFSYYKMVWFLVFTAIGTVMFLYRYFVNEDIYIKKTNIYYPMIVYTVFVILSTIFATHRDVALLGFIDRYENMYVLIGYMLCLFLAINLIDNEEQVKYLFFALGASSIIISIIGIFQFGGMDLFASSFGKKLIVPSQYINAIESIKFQFSGAKRIYGTLFNPNYVGVYMSVLFSLACTVLLLSKDNFIRIFFGIVSLLSLINLLGSGSRAGMISLGFYMVLLLVIFRSLVLKRWKSVLGIGIIIAIIFYGANIYTNGLLMRRLLAVKDSIGTVQINNLKDIVLDNNKAKIIIEDYEINVLYDREGFTFTDKDNKSIDVTIEGNKTNFANPPYDQHSFEVYSYEGYPLLRNNILTNSGKRKFDLVIDTDGRFKFLGSKGEFTDLRKAPSWGFEGRENMASGRGYIWSRSIPMLKDTIFLGHGPDTYALHFPNDDYIGKLRGSGRINVLVDKPHNLYIQTGINTGVISLIALLAIFFMYIKSSIQVFINRKTYESFFEIAGISIFFAVCIYIMTGFLNDSLVSVAPVFWVLLGTGMNINIRLKELG